MFLFIAAVLAFGAFIVGVRVGIAIGHRSERRRARLLGSGTARRQLGS